MNFLPGCGLQGDGTNLLVGPTLDETGDLTECPGSTTARLGGVSYDDDFTNTGGGGGCGEWRTAMILTLRQAPAVPASTHVPTWTKRRRGDVEQRSIGHGGWRQWWRQESA